MAHDHDVDEVEEHDRGLSHDLPTLLSRRRALALLGGAGLAAALAGCGITGGGDRGSAAPGPLPARPRATARPPPGRGSRRRPRGPLAFPEEPCKQVYATDGYSGSLQNLSQTSLDSDMVFSDGYSLQLAKVTGDVTSGYTATLNVPV